MTIALEKADSNMEELWIFWLTKASEDRRGIRAEVPLQIIDGVVSASLHPRITTERTEIKFGVIRFMFYNATVRKYTGEARVQSLNPHESMVYLQMWESIPGQSSDGMYGPQVPDEIAFLARCLDTAQSLATQGAERAHQEGIGNEMVEQSSLPQSQADLVSVGVEITITRLNGEAQISGLPSLSNLRKNYKDYSPETMQDILKAIPEAYALFLRGACGGWWGPQCIADHCGRSRSSVSRHISALKKEGIRRVNGIDLP